MNDATGGHAHCANCGAALADRYCGRCGQDSHVSLSLGHFLHEFVEGLFHVDSSLWRTLRTLVTRPGLLTEQYLGRQAASVLAAVSHLPGDLGRLLHRRIDVRHAESKVVSAGGQEMQASDCAQLAANPGWMLRFVPDLENRACVR